MEVTAIESVCDGDVEGTVVERAALEGKGATEDIGEVDGKGLEGTVNLDTMRLDENGKHRFARKSIELM